MKKIYCLIFFFVLIDTLWAQYADPVKIPIYLSGNFGELRNNHFHSGIDIKTQGAINKPIYSIADGYVSRIFVSPGGYGKALYITHPETGHVSVYAHLESFIPEISDYVKNQQYLQESFRVNLFPDESEFILRKGQLVAYSGNTGSSGGPHLHFEIRDAETEFLLDPLQYFSRSIKDNSAPDIRGLAVYPIEGEGVVNNSAHPLRQNITKNKKGELLALSKPVNAWGKIGLGIKAYDRMTATANIYGVKEIRLYVNDNLVFKSRIDTYHFDQTRMLNSFIDFADWRNNRSFFMKSFVEPANTLPFYEALDGGYITIDKEEVYSIKYELEDFYGNVISYAFTIRGKKQTIPSSRKGSMYMVWNDNNHYLTDAFSLIIPMGNLYKDFIFTLGQTPSDVYLSNVFMVNNEPVPFHDNAEMKIKIKNDTLSDKRSYGIVSIVKNKESWIGGTYNNGYLSTSVREIGARYAISFDNVAPVIEPVQQTNWETQKKIMLRVVDAKSGVLSCRGTVDGKFVLFENDVKSPVYTYRFDASKLAKEQKHSLEFVATDACGNTSVYTAEFYF